MRVKLCVNKDKIVTQKCADENVLKIRPKVESDFGQKYFISDYTLNTPFKGNYEEYNAQF